MSWSFKPGMKVVCIREASGWEPQPWPVKGEVYTISNIIDLGFDRLALELIELPSPEEDGVHAGFRHDAFRPVRTTSIESLRAHLNTKPADKRVDA